MANHNAHEIEGPTDAELADSVAAGYEKQDVSLSVLLRWGFGLGVFLIATSAFAMVLFVALQRPPFAAPALAETSLRRQPIALAPNTPVLQDNPSGDPRADNNPRKGIDNIREFRRDEEIRMAEYATQDGAIHIPIERAMELGLAEFEAQKPGEPPTGITPTPGMKIHADPTEAAPRAATPSNEGGSARP